MELRAISERVQVIPGPVNVGVILLGDDRVALVDSGIDKRFGKNLLEFLSDYRYHVDCILNTHAHADHTGGNAFIQEAVRCRVLAGSRETPGIVNPLIQAVAMYGGAPFTDLMNHFIMAEPSQAENLPPEKLILDDLEIAILDLPGHSIDQKGFLVDGVAFVADTLFPIQTVEKHRLIYTFDPLSHLETLEKMKSISAKTFVGGHFPPCPSIDTLISMNQKHVSEGLTFLKGLLQVPQPMDRIVKEFLNHHKLKKMGWEHFLCRATVQGYLSTLKRRNEADYRVIDNLLVWMAKP